MTSWNLSQVFASCMRCSWTWQCLSRARFADRTMLHACLRDTVVLINRWELDVQFNVIAYFGDFLPGQFRGLETRTNTTEANNTKTECPELQQRLFYSPLSWNTRVSQYQKKHSLTHTYPYRQPSFISFLHLLQSRTSSLFNLHAWQFFCTTSVQVLFGLPLGLEPSTSYSVHFFTQSLSSFQNTCPYHHNLFCCSAESTGMSSNPSLSLSTFYL